MAGGRRPRCPPGQSWDGTIPAGAVAARNSRNATVARLRGGSRLHAMHVPEDHRNLPAEEVTQAAVLVRLVLARPTPASVSSADNDDRHREEQQDHGGVG